MVKHHVLGGSLPKTDITGKNKATNIGNIDRDKKHINRVQEGEEKAVN